MKIRELTLENFRNYEDQTVEFQDGVNVFIGDNAQGKTNALEAIHMLAVGKSHRTARDPDCIRAGQLRAVVSGAVTVRNSQASLRVELTQGGKRAFVNGLSQAKLSDYVGRFQVVLFAPEDLQLIKGGPAQRRRFIDMELGQTHPSYLYHLGKYQRTLAQRNRLLKQPRVDWDSVAVFDAQLALHGAQVVCRRAQFVRQMRGYAREVYRQISDGRETLDVTYQLSLRTPDTEPASLDLSRVDDVRAWLEEALDHRKDADAAAGHTTVGPHRDDLAFTLADQPVHVFASQGQQRSIALSLRLAEIDFIHAETGDYPVLLLDDVLSELDDHRQRNLVMSMKEKLQTIITTTSLAPFHGMLHREMRLFHVHSGIITG
ncbi:MAG: DNA replication/repair protein RecF [Alicyclobacillus sp.]|nr:DNA replication/repair protein RecF [Alicyclobacillus sp.]